MKPSSYMDWLGPVAICGSFALYIGYLSTGDPALCEIGKPCFREWVSALSGWAAAIAALPTVIFLSRQVSAAERHHRENAMLALRRKRSISRQVVVLADEYEQFVEGSEKHWEELLKEKRVSFERYVADIELQILAGVVGDPALRSFEQEVEPLEVSITQVASRIERMTADMKRLPEEVRTGGRQFVMELVYTYNVAGRLHRSAGKQAREFLEITEGMMPQAKLRNRID